MSANLEQKLIEKIHALPLQKQERVLEFVEKLENERDDAKEAANLDEEAEAQARHERRLKLIGIARGRKDLSEKVDEILAEGANKREGWSLP
jgi:hypothetical protein